MKKHKAYISLTLAGALLLSPTGNVIHAQEVNESLFEQHLGNNVSNLQIENYDKYSIDLNEDNYRDIKELFLT